MGPITITYAQTADESGMTDAQRYIYDQGIRYYSVVSCPPEGDSASTTGTSGALSADAEANLRAILEYFTGKGLSLASAAGIAGNIQAESSFDPAKIQGGAIAPADYQPVNGVGFGLAQWTFTSRQQPLVDYANSRGESVTSLAVQLDYMWTELTSGYSSVLMALNDNKSDPVQAAVIFHDGYERSADSPATVISKRGGNATTIYNQYVGTIADGTGVTDFGGLATAAGAASSQQTYCGSGAGSNAPTAGAGQPENTTTLGLGWTLTDGMDYSATMCAEGSADAGMYTHPTRGFTVRLCTTQVGQVASLISQRVVDMINAATAAGIELRGSAFVTYETQWAKRVNNCSDPNVTSTCSPPTAAPGDSMHERGLAIDFVNVSANGPIFNWLSSNAGTYGIFNLPSEPWHWSTSGY